MPEHSEFTVTVRNGDQVIQTITVSTAASNLTVDITRKPELPTRSPLHPDALIFGELVPDLIIRRVARSGLFFRNEAIVVDRPVRARYTEMTDIEGLPDYWVVPVVTTLHGRKLVREYWFLADIGVTPYLTPNGGFSYWNDQNYTLAIR